ncbi:MAG: HAD-IB family hydrolase [Clostridiales bacterium]
MQRNVAAFFDLDGAIIKSHIERNFSFYLLVKKKLSIKRFLSILINDTKLYLNKTDNKEIYKSIVINLTKSIDESDFKKEFNDFYNKRLKKKIYPEVFRLIRKFKNSGVKIYIVSSAIEAIVSEFSNELNADGFVSTKIKIEDNKYTGKIIDKIYFGEDRAKRIRKLAKKENINLYDSYAFGDYSYDSYMLEIVGKPIVVNPDKELKDIAIKRNWKIENWLLG